LEISGSERGPNICWLTDDPTRGLATALRDQRTLRPLPRILATGQRFQWRRLFGLQHTACTKMPTKSLEADWASIGLVHQGSHGVRKAHGWLTVAMLFGHCWDALVPLGLTGVLGNGRAPYEAWSHVCDLVSLAGEKRTYVDFVFLLRMTPSRRRPSEASRWSAVRTTAFYPSMTSYLDATTPALCAIFN